MNSNVDWQRTKNIHDSGESSDGSSDDNSGAQDDYQNDYKVDVGACTKPQLFL